MTTVVLTLTDVSLEFNCICVTQQWNRCIWSP